MKKIMKKNHVIITALAIMIVVAGYLNFTSENEVLNTSVDRIENQGANGNEDDSMISANLEDEVMDDDFIENGEYLEEEIKEDKKKNVEKEDLASVSQDMDGEPIDSENVGEAVLTNASIHLSQAKFNREQTRSKSKEMLLELINNKNISEESKKDAINKMLSLTERMEKENAAEIQLASKGFKDSIVTISDDCVDVTLSIEELSDVQRTQIEDIITRKTGFDLKNIVITTTKEE